MAEINKKQKLLLEYMLADKETFAYSYSILEPEFFEPPLDRVVEFTLGFFKKYHDLPDVDVIDAETDVKMKQRDLEESERDYLLEEIEEHCQTEAMDRAIMTAADFVGEGKLNQISALIREAMLVKIDKSIGLSIFENPKERIENLEKNVVSYSTGIDGLDNLIGKTRRGEFGMIYAISSGGKSLMLANMAFSFARQGLDVAVISLELSQDLYGKRLDVIGTGEDITKYSDLGDRIEKKLMDEVDSGIADITVKFMLPKSTASDIDAYLLEYSLVHGKYPDVLLVDYLAKMGAETRSDNKWDVDEEKSDALRRLAGLHDMISVSAGQINRDGMDVLKLTPAHVAGGMSVINNSDWAVAFAASEEDIDNNQVQAIALKQRNATKTTTPLILYRCPKSLQFSETPFTKTGSYKTPVKNNKDAEDQTPPQKSSKSKLKNALEKAKNK